MSPRAQPWYREVGVLFWLQWKLTLSAFRSRRTRHMSAALRLLLTAVQLLLMVPVGLAMATALGVAIALVTPAAAFEIAVIANTVIALLWMAAPSFYSSQIFERFEMSRLFVHPIRPRSIVIGSAAISLLTMTGLWTLPLLFAQVLGLAWHTPLALPLILLGAVPLTLFLLLLSRIVENLFDLIADDRRLRALMLFLVSVPFMLLGFAQFGIQFLTDDFSRLPSFLEDIVDVERLAEAQSFSEFVEILRPSRLLLWFPPGWMTAGMAYTSTGRWGRATLFLILSTLTVAALLGLHAFATLRLMRGAAVTVGTSTVRRRSSMALLVPSALGALLSKDLRYLTRNPMPRRLVLMALLMAVMFGLSLTGLLRGQSPADRASWAPVEFLFVLLVITSMSLNLGFTANYFGIIDREGLGSLIMTGIDRRLVILSANLAALLLSLLVYGLPIVVVVALLQAWGMLPFLLFFAIALQVSATPAYTLAAILAPYRAAIEMGRHQQGGNIWGMVAWVVSSLPVAALLLGPRFFYPALLWITIPLSAIYAVGVYVVTLRPLASLMLRREHALFEAITSD